MNYDSLESLRKSILSAEGVRVRLHAEKAAGVNLSGKRTEQIV